MTIKIGDVTPKIGDVTPKIGDNNIENKRNNILLAILNIFCIFAMLLT